MKKTLFVIAGFMLMSGCAVSETDATRLLKSEGIDGRTTGWVFFGCGENDTFKTGFEGTKNGAPVSGVICGGWFKKYTIRYK